MQSILPRVFWGLMIVLEKKWREGAKTGGKMTLTVDAAGAAFYSSTTTVSVKRLAAVLKPLFVTGSHYKMCIFYNALATLVSCIFVYTGLFLCYY